MNMDKIKAGENPPFDINVIIEVPVGGDPIKYEMDKESGAIVWWVKCHSYQGALCAAALSVSY